MEQQLFVVDPVGVGPVEVAQPLLVLLQLLFALQPASIDDRVEEAAFLVLSGIVPFQHPMADKT